MKGVLCTPWRIIGAAAKAEEIKWNINMRRWRGLGLGGRFVEDDVEFEGRNCVENVKGSRLGNVERYGKCASGFAVL